MTEKGSIVNASLKLNAILNVIRQLSTLVFPLITFPYVTRILQSENYGKINYSSSINSYFALIAALGFSLYAMREGAGLRDNKKDFTNFANQIFTLNIGSTIVAILLELIFLLFWKGKIEYKILMAIYCVGYICSTLGVEWICNIYEDYLYITIRTIIIQILSMILLFTLVHNSNDFYISAMIQVFSSSAGYIFSFFYVRKYTRLKLVRVQNWKKHFLPILILFSNSALVSIYLNSDVTILGTFKGDAVVGIYTVAVNIYSIVKNCLNAINGVTIPRLTYYIRTNNKKDFKILADNVFKMVITLGIPALTGLFLLSDNAIIIISGESYLGASTALKILSIALIMASMANLFTSGILIANGEEKKVLTCTIVGASLNISLNFIFIPMFSLNGAAFTTLVAETCVFIMSMFFSRKYYNLSNVKKTIFKVMFGSFFIIVVCKIITILDLMIFVDTLLKILVSVFVYFFIQIVLQNDVLLEPLKNRRKRNENH